MKLVLFCLVAALYVCGSARADDDAHDRARRAVEEGRILPLKDILARSETAYPGQLIEAELEEERGVTLYELKILTNDGRVMKVLYDARTGEQLKAKSRDAKR